MTVVAFLGLVAAAGLAGYALLVRLGLDDLDAWAGGRLAGLVLAAVPAWWLGVVGVAEWRVLGGVVLLAGAAAGGVVIWRRRQRWRELATAEAIFTLGLLLVLLIRLDHPQIAGQEKPMDVGIFASLLRTDGFPPPDMWLAGESLPYYYWGALIWTVPLAMSRLPLEIGYNMVVALIGGMVFAALWVLGRGLAGGSHAAGLMAGFFGLFAGTPDAVRQLLGDRGLRTLDIWRSSRQHEDLITEFPLFTAWLGDLHPHLLSMPIAAVVLLVAYRAGRDGPRGSTVAALAGLFGITWAANPWAMPPTFGGIALLLLCADGRWHWPTTRDGRSRWLAAALVAGGGWLVTAPFHLGFVPFFQGIKPVFAWTAPGDLLLYAGHLLLPTLAAVIVLGAPRAGSDPARTLALTLGAAALVVVAAAASHRPTLTLLGAALLVLTVRLVGSDESSERPALALATLGLFLFLIPEIVYVVDGYGERLHRMNTVFKSWIQGWMFLALALPVLFRICARQVVVRRVLVAVMVLVSLPHLVWAVLNQFSGRPLGVDGMAWMTPGDQAIVRHLRGQPNGTSLIEAVGGAYTDYARLSANSGVPAFLGWANHQLVWRGNGIVQETERRTALVNDLYSCGDPARVRELVAEAGVDLVALGSLEHRDFPAEGVAAVRAAGDPELDSDWGQVVRFERPEPTP